MALNNAQLQALSHPLRLRILGMVANDPGRSLSPVDIANDLGKGATVSQVAYHLARLQDVELVHEQATRDDGPAL